MDAEGSKLLNVGLNAERRSWQRQQAWTSPSVGTCRARPALHPFGCRDLGSRAAITLPKPMAIPSRVSRGNPARPGLPARLGTSGRRQRAQPRATSPEGIAIDSAFDLLIVEQGPGLVGCSHRCHRLSSDRGITHHLGSRRSRPAQTLRTFSFPTTRNDDCRCGCAWCFGCCFASALLEVPPPRLP